MLGMVDYGNNHRAFRSYELNVVLDDASRRNLVCHGDHARLRQDASTLAAFLNVPLWDAS